VVAITTHEHARRRRTRRHAAFTTKPTTLPRLEGALLIKRQGHSNLPNPDRPPLSASSNTSYKDALMSIQVPQQTNPNQTRQTPPEDPQPSNMEQVFARFEGIVERMMEKMFSQITQLLASILNAKACKA